jgi:hypothetical protein
MAGYRHTTFTFSASYTTGGETFDPKGLADHPMPAILPFPKSGKDSSPDSAMTSFTGETEATRSTEETERHLRVRRDAPQLRALTPDE